MLVQSCMFLIEFVLPGVSTQNSRKRNTRVKEREQDCESLGKFSFYFVHTTQKINPIQGYFEESDSSQERKTFKFVK